MINWEKLAATLIDCNKQLHESENAIARNQQRVLWAVVIIASLGIALITIASIGVKA